MIATVLAFAALCAVSIRRGIAVRGANVWLAVSFASVAAAGAMVPELDATGTPTRQLVALLVVGAALLLHPVALVQFSHTLRPVPRSVRLAVRGAAVALMIAVVVLGALDPSTFGDAEPTSVPGVVVLGATALLWLGVALFVGVRLALLGQRLTSSVGRARARTLAAGVLALGPAVGVPFLVPDLDESAGAVFALGACATMALGYLPPRWLRWAWARRDTLRLTEVERAALRYPEVDLAPWLETVRRVWDADAVWLQVDGDLVAAAGSDEAPPGGPSTPHAAGDGVHVSRVGPARWLLCAEVRRGRLTARTTIDPVLIDEVSDLFLATAGRLHSAAVRRGLESHHRDEQAAAHAAETSRLRDDVLSTLSHELRTPLVTLRGVPEVLLSRWDSLAPDDVRTLLERVHENALSLHRLVEATLLLAQVRASEIRPRSREVAAGEVIDDALQRLRWVGVDVGRVVIGDAEGLAVTTDLRLAAAVLAELLHNALTYSEASQPVAVWARATTDERVELVVRDHGRGLVDGAQDRLREAFSRDGDLLTRDRRGLGIGLTLVSELAPLLHADLVLHAPHGEGTEVRVVLPVRSSGPAVPPDPPTGAGRAPAQAVGSDGPSPDWPWAPAS